MFFISVLVFSWTFSIAQDYTYTRDQNTVTVVDINGVVVGYYEANNGQVDVYNANYVQIGYYQIDQHNPNTITYYSTGSAKGSTFYLPSTKGLFKPVKFETNPNAMENFIKNIQAIQNCMSGTSELEEDHRNIRQEDYQNEELNARIKYEQKRTEYLRDSIIKSRQAFFDQPKAIVPFKLVVDNKEYFLTEDYVECHHPVFDEKIKGRMWCYDYNHKLTGFYMENPVRGMDFYKVKNK